MKEIYKSILNKAFKAFIIILSLPLHGQDWRPLDGVGTNHSNIYQGAAHTMLQRLAAASYEDSVSSVQTGFPNSREISNEIVQQDLPVYNSFGLSDAFWCFGQFIDHDLVINRGNRGELIIVNVPVGDPYFDPHKSGNVTLRVDRGRIMPESGISKENPREHINETTAFIDGSVIYGIDSQRLNWMRTGRNGQLKVSENDLLPYNTYSGEYIDDVDFSAPLMELPPENRPIKYFVNGDIRANEHPGLAVFHILFVREHNRLCNELVKKNPQLEDEEVFQIARKWVGALLQNITYNEWLPALGVVLPEYAGYDESSDPSITNEFSSVAFRFGHSMVNETLLRIVHDGEVSDYGSIQIKDTFFKTEKFLEEGGIDPILRGMSYQLAQELDEQIVGTLRNFLFGPPGSGGMDLAVLNIERSRERGIPSLNVIRKSIELEPYRNFEFLQNESLQTQFSNFYEDIDQIEPWIGMLAEPHYGTSILGQTMHVIIKDQFLRTRNGDRFWFENDSFFNSEDVEKIRNTSLADVVKRNTDIIDIPEEMFFVDLNNVLSVSGLEEARSINVKLYPNPAIDHVNVIINSKKQWVGTLQITNLSGQIILEKQLNVVSGKNKFTFNISDKMESGIYQVIIQNLNGGSFRLIKR